MAIKNYLKLIAAIILLFVVDSTKVVAQDQPETSEEKDDFFWALRLGTGYQYSGFLEAGISRWYLSNKKFGSAALLYSTVECSPNINGLNDKPIWGLKLGIEAYSAIFAWGIELKQLTNFERNSFVVTPKVGVGLLGACGLFIGYNFRDKANDFPAIGKWQLSLNVNLSKQAYRQYLL